MNTRSSDQSRDGQASGRHQGLYRPDDDKHIARRLNDVGADADAQDAYEDELRDRGGRGTPSTSDARSDGNDDEARERR